MTDKEEDSVFDWGIKVTRAPINYVGPKEEKPTPKTKEQKKLLKDVQLFKSTPWGSKRVARRKLSDPKAELALRKKERELFWEDEE